MNASTTIIGAPAPEPPGVCSTGEGSPFDGPASRHPVVVDDPDAVRRALPVPPGRVALPDPRAGGRDLEPYFERWIYDTGLPELRWSTRSEETLEGYETTVQVRTKAAPQVRRVELEPGGGSWTITSPEPVRDVRINEDRGILAETEKVRKIPQR
jgi:hypothetical protein